MRKLLLLLLMCMMALWVRAEEPEDKTFLVLFDKQELKALKTSPEFIQLSLEGMFTTKIYSGNSDAALIISIPNCNLDECEIAKLIVNTHKNILKPLEDISFRIIDINKNRHLFEAIASDYSEDFFTKKKLKALK